MLVPIPENAQNVNAIPQAVQVLPFASAMVASRQVVLVALLQTAHVTLVHALLCTANTTALLLPMLWRLEAEIWQRLPYRQTKQVPRHAYGTSAIVCLNGSNRLAHARQNAHASAMSVQSASAWHVPMAAFRRQGPQLAQIAL
jgi:hypothetical protein